MSTHKFLYLFEKLSKNLFKEQRFVYDEKPADKPPAAVETDPKSAETNRAEAERKIQAEKAAQELIKLNEDLSKLDQTKFDQIVKDNIKEKESKGELNTLQIEALATFAANKEPEKNIKTLYGEFTDNHLQVNQFSEKTVKIFIEKITNATDIKKLIEKMAETVTTANTLIKAAENDEAKLKQIFDEIKNKDTIKNINAESLKTIANKLNPQDFTELLSKISKEQKGELLNTGLNEERKEKALVSILKDIKSLSELNTKTCDNVINYLCSNKNIEGLNKTLDDKMLDDAACAALSKESVQLLLKKTYSEDGSNAIYKKVLEKADPKVKADLVKDTGSHLSEKTRTSLISKIEGKEAPKNAEADPKIKNFTDTLDSISTDFEKKTAPAEITDPEAKKDVELYYKQAATAIKNISEHHKKVPTTKIGDRMSNLVSSKDLTNSFKADWDKEDTSKNKVKEDFIKTIAEKLEQKAKNTAAEIAKENPDERKKTAEYVNKLLEAFQKISDRNGFMKKAENTLSKCLSSITDKADRTEPRTALKDIEIDYELWGVKYIEAFKSSEKIEKTIQLIIAKALNKDIKDPDVTELLIDTFGGEKKVEPKSEPKAEKKEEPKTPEAAKPEIEKFTDKMSIPEILKASGFELNGKSIKWTFEIPNGENDPIESERSILNTKKFQKILDERDSSGNFKVDTPNKLRLSVYKYLWENIYKSGAVKNKYKKADFEKSQQFLQNEIARLEATIKDKPAIEKGLAPATDTPAKEPKTAEIVPLRSRIKENLKKDQTLEVDSESKDASSKKTKYKDYKEAKVALDKRIVVKLGEIMKIASDTASLKTEAQSPDKRNIIITGPLKDTPSGQIYDIKIDGKDTPFKLEIYKDLHSDKVEFRFKKPNEYSAFAEYSDKKVAEEFAAMLDKTPNDRVVKDFDEAIKSAEKEIKIETKEPKNLTVNQLKTLKNSRDGIINAIKTGENLFDTLEAMKKFAKEGQSVLSISPIAKITFDTTPAIVWDVQNKDAPFGKEDALTASILAIKEKELGGKETDEYKDFKEKTSTKESEIISKSDELARTKEYRQKFKELTEKTYELQIGSLDEEEIISKWKNMAGSAKVNNIMKNPPFSLNQDGEIAANAAKIISEWSNSEVDFADVFKSVKDVPELKSKGLISLIEKPGEFMEIFDKLLKSQENGTLTNPSSQEQLELMFNKVLVPCLELLKAFEELQMPKETKQKEKDEELQGEQKEIMDALTKLCDFNDTKNSGWSEFLASAYGGKDKITMSDINGKTFTINKGQFHNKYDPKAALAILTNINEDNDKDGAPNHYTFNDKGAKLLNKQAMLGEINNRIIIGVTNMVMAEAGQKGSKLEGKDLNMEIKMRLVDYLVIDFKNITPDQIKAFQLGFVVKQSSKFAEKIADAKQALSESSENPTIRNHPLFKQIASSLLDQGIEPGKVRTIQEKVLFAAGASFKSTNGGGYKFEGAGIGTKIDIGDGMSILIGIGANTDGKIIAGVGFSVDVYRGNGVIASVGIEIGTCGATIGASQTVDAGKVKIHAFEGFRWSWDSIIPTTGGSLGMSWNMENQLKEDLAAAEGKTDYSKVWNEWKSMPQSDIEGKYAKLASIPRLWRPIEAVAKEFDLSKADVVNIVEGIKDQLTEKVMKNLSSPIPIFSYGGFGMLGLVPVPQVGFKLGSASITIPNRRAISKILHELSDITVTNALKKAVAAIDNKEKTARFIEQTGKLVYGHDGKLLSLVKSESIDFSKFPQAGLDTHNKELKRAEMKLTKNANGTTELKVLGPDMKDIEIHIDPKLTELGIIKDGSSIMLEGNTDDLIISRERFELPFGATAGSASIRDVITIRQTGSLRGNRDANWIQTYESAFFQKLENEAEFSMQAGNNAKDPQKNIHEIDGYGKKSADDIGKIEATKNFIAKRPNMEGRLDAKQAEEFGKQTERRHAAMEKRGSAMKLKEYEKLKVRTDLFKNLEDIFPKKNDFTKEFRTNIDEPEKLVKTLVEHSNKINVLKNLNAKEINLAITHLTNLHYTNVYAEATTKKADGTEEISVSEIRKINQGILKGMEKKIKFVRDEVLMPTFTKTINEMSPKPTSTAKQLVDKLINDTFNPLREKLNDPDFDFRKIKVELIPGGAYLFSGSRQYKNGVREGALSQNISYETLEKDKQLLLGFGLLKGTTGSYKLDSTNVEEKELARVILEISSPIPKEDIEFLESPLALKFAGLNSGVLLCFNEGNKFDDYAKITEVYEKPELLQNSPAHKEAVGRFRKLIEEVRAAQLDGKTFEKKIGNTGLTVKIKMSAEIKRGAYSKCTNPSFYAEESAEVSIFAKGGRIVAQFNTSNEVIDAEASKLFASFGLGIGFRNEKVKVATPEAGPGGKVNQGGGHRPPPATGQRPPAAAPSQGGGQAGGGNSNNGAGQKAGESGGAGE